MKHLVLALSVACVATQHAPAAGQSLLSAGGLGTPVEALDGRSRALGSVGVGLSGATVLPTDLARARALFVPMFTFTLQPTSGTVSRDGIDSQIEGTRFPLIGFAYPVGTLGVATLSYGGFLDQRWKAESATTLVLAGESVDATDVFESTGGVAVARLGFTRPVTESLVLAASVGVYTGRQTRVFTRTLDADQLGASLDPFVTRARWRMHGNVLSLGAMWDPAAFLRVSGSVAMSGDLEATPTNETEGGPRTFGLPTEIRLGASASLTPVIMATFGFSMADWSSAGIDAEEEVRSPGSVKSLGGGLEWTGLDFWGRGLPLRLGYRRTELPFGVGTQDPVERVFATGFGWNLLETETLLIAALDFSLERGTRDAGSISESFRRYTVSFRVASF